ncbi:unnamed protein product [Cylicostephanus goldi]|uniref:Uncharacterized protein n=1 Tax=Cylicostephanus goldi TaxID=71465 RepID=A0A3P6S4K9_CYLGO|nr:unnamed protein product [Cylicostephanus goldi]
MRSTSSFDNSAHTASSNMRTVAAVLAVVCYVYAQQAPFALPRLPKVSLLKDRNSLLQVKVEGSKPKR